MINSTTRRRALLIGLLLCLPVMLVGGLPAEAWRLAGRHLSADGATWTTAHAHPARVAHASPVVITGRVRGPLSPGVSRSINLTFANPSSQAVTLRSVTVTVLKISAPLADAQHPCTRADFRVRPMRTVTLVVPRRGSTSLVRLAVPLSQRPHLKMRNRPVNQDGCKGAHLTLGYRGYGDRWR